MKFIKTKTSSACHVKRTNVRSAPENKKKSSHLVKSTDNSHANERED